MSAGSPQGFPCGPADRRRGGAPSLRLPRRASSIALSEWESPPSAGERDNLPRARLRVTPRRRARGPEYPSVPMDTPWAAYAAYYIATVTRSMHHLL